MVEIDPSRHTPGEVFRYKRRCEPGDEPVQTGEMAAVRRFSTPE
jgi:hypothetical protein